jgi:hypothetical protein
MPPRPIRDPGLWGLGDPRWVKGTVRLSFLDCRSWQASFWSSVETGANRKRVPNLRPTICRSGEAGGKPPQSVPDWPAHRRRRGSVSAFASIARSVSATKRIPHVGSHSVQAGDNTSYPASGLQLGAVRPAYTDREMARKRAAIPPKELDGFQNPRAELCNDPTDTKMHSNPKILIATLSETSGCHLTPSSSVARCFLRVYLHAGRQAPGIHRAPRRDANSCGRGSGGPTGTTPPRSTGC